MRRVRDLDPYVCRPWDSIQQAMARINQIPELFQLVIDDNNHFLGTLTDGDIRRALLQGADLSTMVEKAVNRDATVGCIGDDELNAHLLDQVPGLIAFLPVLGPDHVLAEILITPPRRSQPFGKALVMAGGFGRRLGDKTRKTPKPLLPVGDQPIIGHLLDRLDAAGFQHVAVAVHHLADQFDRYLGNRRGAGDVALIRESEPLGTAGAIALLAETPCEPFLVINADVMTEIDFSAMRAFHERHEYDGTIAVAQHELTIPFGVIHHDEDGLLESIVEKPRLVHAVSAGIYYLAPEFHALVPTDRPIDMPELLNIGREAGLKIGLFPVHEYWRDVGRPDDLEAAHREFEAMVDAKAGG